MMTEDKLKRKIVNLWAKITEESAWVSWSLLNGPSDKDGKSGIRRDKNHLAGVC